LRQRLKWDWEGLRARADDGAAATEAVLGRWLGELDQRPFFWFVNLVECHSPYLPPRPFQPFRALTRLRAADEAYRYLNFDSIVRNWLGVDAAPVGAVRRMRRLYAASLRHLDDWVRRLLASLTAVGAMAQTLIIVCSDHGENLGEGGLTTHGLSLDDRLLRVPLVAAGPGAEAFEGIQSLAELPARIAMATELEEHPWRDGLVAGLPVAQWDPFDLSSERVLELQEQWRLDNAAVHRLTSPLTCAVSGRFKLACGANEGDEELYDLDADPLELSPLRGEAALAACGGESLSTLRAAVHHPAVQATAEVDLAPDVSTARERAEIERRMQLLGYL
jgi:arylsulfatase A-like enzyme